MPVISGRVVDPEGRPVANAVVHVVSSPRPLPDIAQLADEEGAFVMSLGPGTHVIGARSDAAGSGQAIIEVPADPGASLELVVTLTDRAG